MFVSHSASPLDLYSALRHSICSLVKCSMGCPYGLRSTHFTPYRAPLGIIESHIRASGRENLCSGAFYSSFTCSISSQAGHSPRKAPLSRPLRLLQLRRRQPPPTRVVVPIPGADFLLRGHFQGGLSLLLGIIWMTSCSHLLNMLHFRLLLRGVLNAGPAHLQKIAHRLS